VDDQTERDWLDRRDRWCVNCKRNVCAQKAGSSAFLLVAATMLMVVLGGFLGIGVAVLANASQPTVNAEAALAIGAGLGLLVALIAIGADDHRCAICKSANLKDAR
jgi:hypothetical protein